MDLQGMHTVSTEGVHTDAPKPTAHCGLAHGLQATSPLLTAT
jgi:hypothetical protein